MTDLEANKALRNADNERLQRSLTLSRELNKEPSSPLTIKLSDPDVVPVFNATRRLLSLPDEGDHNQILEMARYVLNPPITDQVVPGAFGGETTKSEHYKIPVYFAGGAFDTQDYRLDLRKLQIKNGVLDDVIIPCGQSPVEFMEPPDGFTAGMTSNFRSLYDSGRNHSDTGYAPWGRVSSGNRNQLKSVGTGKKDRRSSPYGSMDPEKSGNCWLAEQPLCHPTVKERLDNDVFSPKARVYPPCRELQKIKAIPEIAPRLIALSGWCRRFGDTNDIPGQRLDLLINLIQQQQGVCQHRSWVFQVLCEYFRVLARMVSNVAHQYVEISPDGGKNWRKVDLGGGGQCTCHDKSSLIL